MGLLALLVAIGVFNSTLQNYFCKNLFKTKGDNFAFTSVYYLVAVITVFIFNGCKIGKVSLFTVWDSILYDLMLTMELYCMLEALKHGSMSLTNMFIMASIMIPIIPSWIFWGDPITWNQVVGILVMFVAIAFILNIGSDLSKDKFNWKWFTYSFIAFVGSGMAAVADKLLTISEYADQTNDFVCVGLGFAVVFMVLVLLLIRKKEPVTMKMTPKVLVPTMISGAAYSFLCLITMWVVAILPASVAYTVNNGARLIIITIIDVILFKEKIRKLQYVGLGLGIVGVVLLSI